jgi:two-component system cell cycle sensor histidine kinase/response regulator CckA
MVKIKQLSVERQVLLAFSAIGLLVVAIGGLLIFSPQSVQQNISKQHSIASSEMMGQMQPNGLRGISTIGMVVDVLAGISLVITAGAGFFIARTARRLEEDNRLFQIQIAEQKEMQESLQLLGSAITQSKDAILITEAELDAPGPKIVFVNPAFTKMTGYTADEALGKTPRILQGPRTDKAVLNRLLKNLHEGEVFEGETVNYRKNGEELEIEWQIAPIRNAAGTITNFVGIQRDIKERKTHEARLFQSQKMETIGRLAGGFAHEFNSIMTAIIGQSEMILGDLSQGTPAVNRAMEIRHAADRAAILTRQLLAYGRRQILQPEILDLNKILIEMTETLQHLMGKEVEVQIIPNPELKAVKIDPGQMEQVLLNMAINAADAMPNGGKFLLETSNVTLDEAYVCPFAGLKSGDYVMLAISDTGFGMSEEVKARVFEPFFSTKGVGEGTGLGLSACYGILRQSHGHINVYSELARGSTFKIYLPQVEQPAKTSTSRLKSRTLPRGTETILLAEDDPSLLNMAADLLKRQGYTVLTAVDGVAALNLKQQRDIGHIDLLLTDVVMPHMSGKELADRIRAIYPRTKILFTSAYTESVIVHQGILTDGLTLLQKPYTPSTLANKVRELLDRPFSFPE